MNIDQQLIQDCIREDRKAQFQLYRKCFPMLMGVCMRYQKNEEDAAAVLNLGFLKILKGLKKYPSHIPFEAWTKRIVINTIIDEFRKNRKVRELIRSVDYKENLPNENVDFNLIEEQIEIEELENMLQGLPPMTRKVFNLFAIDEFKHKEIAELLSISINTSKWHLSHARKRLQEMLRRKLEAPYTNHKTS